MNTAKRKPRKNIGNPGKASKAELAKRIDAVETDDTTEMPKLSKPHMLFCTHYAMSFNGRRSVMDAAIPSERPDEMARYLLSKTEIQTAVKLIRKDLGELHFDLANQLLAQYNDMRLADPSQIYDDNGNLRPMADWPEGCKLLLTGMEVEETMVGEGDAAVFQRLKKVKLEGRKGVMDSMNRVLGTFIDKRDVTSGGKPLPAAVTAVVNITVGKSG